MTNRVLLDAFSAKMKTSTSQVNPSVPVTMYAISPEPNYAELRCLITVREFSPGETVLKCSSDFDDKGLSDYIRPDNVNMTLRAGAKFDLDDRKKMAIWLNTDTFTDVCKCESARSDKQADGDQEVKCNWTKDSIHDEHTDPHFILSKITEDDMKTLSLTKASDADSMYRLHTNEGNLCRLIDYRGHVTCVSNETASDHLGVFFRVISH